MREEAREPRTRPAPPSMPTGSHPCGGTARYPPKRGATAAERRPGGAPVPPGPPRRGPPSGAPPPTGRPLPAPAEETENVPAFASKRRTLAVQFAAVARVLWLFLHVFFMSVLCTAPESPLRLGLDGRRAHSREDDPDTPHDESTDPVSPHNYAAYTAFFFLLYFANALLYLWASASHPGYLPPGREERAEFHPVGPGGGGGAGAGGSFLADYEAPPAPAGAPLRIGGGDGPAGGGGPGAGPSAGRQGPPGAPASAALGAGAGPPGESAAAAAGPGGPRALGGAPRGISDFTLGRERDLAVCGSLLPRWDPEAGGEPEHGDIGPWGKYCGRCSLWQAPRVKHCYDCGR